MQNPGNVFITGGASGLGAAIAAKFFREGWTVCIGDVNVETGNAMAEKYSDNRLLFMPCDVTSMSDLESTANRLKELWGRVDVVVNNAGVAVAGGIDSLPEADWQHVVEINLLGVARSCKAFTPIFKKQGSGYFINVASMAGIIHLPFMSAYNATKAAVIALSESLLMELSPHGVGVTVVCPSFFRTNLDKGMRSTEPGMYKIINKLFDKSPVNADDVAGMTYDGFLKGEFYVLTHPKSRTAFLMKKLLPVRAYHKSLLKQSKPFLDKFGK